ncbi:uncharacterized protein M421DRAFT_395133 [Didymella exigua CBS 183.55]|uniref:Rhodopsin domain-containing protein n=1 Tax=Didymella exigua CBS 183.55 TaxID=1150837 RepID=A0A6A5S1L6_9PLEO|nr:uncharacterized protein M421DRAFT_395133 [Didymella exigua CBS 183.55]KAF1933178.1 hypothetical protein M421DRAFT_395133 [Didymella exigua CBS 183.55]
MAFDYFANPPSDLDLTESRTASNNAVGIVLFALSALFVGLRLLTRLRLKREPLGLDDHLMFIGLALNAGNLACCIAGGFFGLGKHIWSLDQYQMRHITIITFVYVFIYAWSVCIIKFSILALYRRIFGMTWMGWFCVALTAGYLITNHIVLPLYTRPLDYYWNQWNDDAQGVVQVDEAKFYLGVGIINLFGDICILTVPISSVIQLRLARTQKIAISLIFLLGSFVCFASMYRIITITRLVRTTDISWAKSDVFIWSTVEPSVGIISGCLPTLRPLMLHILQSWFNFIPSERSSSGKVSRSISLNAIETIGKKRTRKISKQDTVGGSQFTELNDCVDAIEGRRGQHSREWRPDEDEMCLTTTTVHAHSDSRPGTERSTPEARDGGGINVTKEFEWDEAITHPDKL